MTQNTKILCFFSISIIGIFILGIIVGNDHYKQTNPTATWDANRSTDLKIEMEAGGQCHCHCTPIDKCLELIQEEICEPYFRRINKKEYETIK